MTISSIVQNVNKELIACVFSWNVLTQGLNFFDHTISYLWCKTDGEKEDKGSNGDVGIEVKGKRKRGRPKKTWKTQVKKESKSVGLEKDDALNRARWSVGAGEIAIRVG